MSTDDTESFVRKLQNERQASEASRRLDNLAEALSAARPLYECLAEAGFPVDRPAELIEDGDRRALPCLLDALGWLEHEGMRIEVIAALSAKWAQPEGARALIDQFDKTPILPRTEALREAIASSVLNCTDYEILDDIMRIAADDRQGEQRLMFVAALGRYGRRSSEIAPHLLNIMNKEPNSIGIEAARSLQKIGRGLDVVPWLLDMRDHRTANVARDANRMLKQIGKPLSK